MPQTANQRRFEGSLRLRPQGGRQTWIERVIEDIGIGMVELENAGAEGCGSFHS